MQQEVRVTYIAVPAKLFFFTFRAQLSPLEMKTEEEL